MSYLIHVSILLGGMYLFYWLLLRKETFFKLNRWVLLASLLLALLVPLVKVPAAWSLRSGETASRTAPVSPTMTAPNGAILTAPPAATAGTPAAVREEGATGIGLPGFLSRFPLLPLIYFLGVGIFTAAFLVQLFVVLRKRRKLQSIRDGLYTIYELKDDTPPFSFGSWIFLNPARYDPDTYQQILDHEKLHVAQAHTLDKIIAELTVILLWFNPFAWLMRTAITKNLEYLTDAEMLSAGNNPTTYQMSLVKVSVPQHALNLTTNYNESFLKKRVIMMNTKKSSARSSWKYLLLLPLLAVSMLSLNATQALPEIAMAQDDHADIPDMPSGTVYGDDEIPASVLQSYREVITKKLSFANLNDGAEKVLAVRNITGGVDVVGYDGDEILVTVEKIIKADSPAELEKGKKEVQLGIAERDDVIFLYHESPYTSLDPNTGDFNISNCGGGNCYNYQFYLHYKVQVPRSLSLGLSTINGGDIKVASVYAKTIEAKHVSNSVYMTDVTGVREIFTVSGHIKVNFRENPQTPSSFVSTSGDVELDLVDKDFGAEVSYSTMSGELITSFPVRSTNKATGLMNISNSPVTIGRGGERMEIRSISGNLVLK
ncbi:M56 family metallopeptidase [Lewinella sp. W8]|uniref:M56 family metallopeptidase n=1 Tax=Lewinella sp. W8 TaxID=2528208 RepID=UPI001068CA2F|nr:M56 family metallopeptidase [Lewinella sp. W8]MTB52040.1 hypothetical protein [Lewinella sp. W8]